MARFLADLEGKLAAEYRVQTPAGTIIPVVRVDDLICLILSQDCMMYEKK